MARRTKCPKCGKLCVDIRKYPKEKFWLFVHSKVNRGFYIDISDSCRVEKEEIPRRLLKSANDPYLNQ